ncbi:PREDICTED: peptidase inhibitor R3HDML [Elephantulus edwardii]|uniref:peptidase inhibitor R3HDML n=1 Tax=Elephantulus edwardii TaxID=28737 RepID=UPI0003F0D3DD|nr:PREDICTED: peptidase inhibitor R3HDML [Elephantulus edwardii]
MPLPSSAVCLLGLLFWAGQTSNALMLPNATLELAGPKVTVPKPLTGPGLSRFRRKRHLSAQDMKALLDYHNFIRSSVYPPAANMEYMVWDEQLARSAAAWASQCIWAHGPSQLMRYVGQNLSVFSGRYNSVTDLAKLWSDEKQYYLYPSPRECNPHCPWHCNGPLCTHYTQMVWATSNRLGCAIHTCGRINVWGNSLYQAAYLVCNYSFKGNWIGEAPYKMGRPCSACPPSYRGSCYNNMCFNGIRSNWVR